MFLVQKPQIALHSILNYNESQCVFSACQHELRK